MNERDAATVLRLSKRLGAYRRSLKTVKRKYETERRINVVLSRCLDKITADHESLTNKLNAVTQFLSDR